MMQEATKIDWNTTVAVISVITAITALFVGPITSYYIIKRQIVATVLSNERKEWIYNLRLDVATFLSKIIELFTATEYVRRLGGDEVRVREMTDIICAISLLHAKIEIMLDTSVESHKALDEILTEASSLIRHPVENLQSQEFSTLLNAIIPATKLVIAEKYKSIAQLK
jgi:hypothetical protein